MIIQKMHNMGIRSEHAHLVGMAFIGPSIAAWATSITAELGVGLARADRWGIYVGEWAPTFVGLGLALSQYEQAEWHAAGERRPSHKRK
jgi:hypothetical protein